MHRTTIYLEPDLLLALRQLAQREQCSQAAIIRSALERYVSEVQEPVTPALPGVGRYRSGRSDVSEQAETILRGAAHQRR